jgi:ribosome biogenesis protein ERB1
VCVRTGPEPRPQVGGGGGALSDSQLARQLDDGEEDEEDELINFLNGNISDDEEEVQKNGPEWREVTADEWFKEEDGNSSFGDAEFGSSDEEPYDSADDEDDEEVYGSEDDEEEERAAREEEEDELNGGEEDEEDEDEDHDQLNPENFQKLVSWLGRHDPPEAEESEDETHNTVGNVPMHWYADYPHIGYDVEGKRIMKKQGPVKDEMDRFLDRTDDPNYWCLYLPPLSLISFIYRFISTSGD